MTGLFPNLEPPEIRRKFSERCLDCKEARGLHRYGNEACPNNTRFWENPPR